MKRKNRLMLWRGIAEPLLEGGLEIRRAGMKKKVPQSPAKIKPVHVNAGEKEHQFFLFFDGQVKYNKQILTIRKAILQIAEFRRES